MAYAESTGYYGGFDIRRITPDEVVGSEGGYARGPVRALMAALLFDGIQAYIGYAQLSKTRRSINRYREAFNWVNHKDPEYIFSFNCVCEALGIDPEFLRLGLINICNSRDDLKRSRRNF